MTERDEQMTGHPFARHVHGSAPDDDSWREQTTPGIPAVGGPGTAFYGTPAAPPAAADPAAQGYPPAGYAPSGYPTAGYGPAGYPATAPEYSSRPVAVRRADPLAGLLLLLTGMAAGLALLLHWLAGGRQTGLVLLRDGLRGWRNLVSTGMWQPVAVLLGGGLLFLLGLLMLIPARAHRLLGLLAFLVALLAAAGVLVPLADADWHLAPFGAGFWCAIAVAGLGLLGSLKALLSGPRSRRAA